MISVNKIRLFKQISTLGFNIYSNMEGTWVRLRTKWFKYGSDLYDVLKDSLFILGKHQTFYLFIYFIFIPFHIYKYNNLAII
jgi:hypothetical protein